MMSCVAGQLPNHPGDLSDCLSDPSQLLCPDYGGLQKNREGRMCRGECRKISFYICIFFSVLSQLEGSQFVVCLGLMVSVWFLLMLVVLAGIIFCYICLCNTTHKKLTRLKIFKNSKHTNLNLILYYTLCTFFLFSFSFFSIKSNLCYARLRFYNYILFLQGL